MFLANSQPVPGLCVNCGRCGVDHWCCCLCSLSAVLGHSFMACYLFPLSLSLSLLCSFLLPAQNNASCTFLCVFLFFVGFFFFHINFFFFKADSVMENFLSPLVKADSFVRFISLGWLQVSCRTWNTLLQALLIFKISSEKSDVILTGFSSICHLWGFPLEAFNRLSLFCMFNVVLTMTCRGDFLSCSCLFGVLIISSTYVGMSLLSLGKFSSMILLKSRFMPLI